MTTLKSVSNLLWRCTAALFVSFSILVSTPSGFAQNTLRIAAVVNDDIISAYDLQARTMLIIILSKLPRNQQTMQRISPQVLRSLVDEKLRLQEAERLGIQVSQAEIEAALANAGRVNRFAPGEIINTLENLGIGLDTFLEQIRAEIAWSRLLPQQYGQNIEITDEEISAALAEETARQNQPQYLLSEILLAVDSPANAPAVKQQAEELLQELRNGADFSSLARSFSQGPTASQGGSLGWLRLDQLTDIIKPIIQTMNPGGLSNAIPIPGGFMIFQLHDKRTQTGQTKKSTVTLSQFHLDLPNDATPDSVQSYIATAREKTSGLSSCTDLQKAAEAFASPLSGSLGKVSLSKLPSQMAGIVKDLPVGKPSEPIRTDNAVLVLMVCDREKSKGLTEEQKRDRIYRNIFGQRIAVYARQAIRDLRRAAFIDIR